ncbi:MAG: hypothetical protein EOP04_20960 [Proteobacteria bacterium]|nr:MAG: hypothetical protein EOP04_20960 [Pseudomonadota bacterium]
MRFCTVIAILLSFSFAFAAKDVAKPSPTKKKSSRAAAPSEPIIDADSVKCDEETKSGPTFDDDEEIRQKMAEANGLLDRAKGLLFKPRKLAKPQKAYLDFEDGRPETLTSIPGRDWRTCLLDKNCEAAGWPDRDSEVNVLTEPTSVKYYDHRAQKIVSDNFVQISTVYVRRAKKDSCYKGALVRFSRTGWVLAGRIQKEKLSAFFPEKITNGKPPICRDDRTQKNLKDLSNVTKHLEKINDIAAEVSKVTGQCIDIPNSPGAFKAGNVYDKYFLEKIMAQTPPKVRKDNGELMTPRDLVDIDAMARSIYGEMAGCFKKGLQYPMTVGKIIENRGRTCIPGDANENKGKCSLFVQGDHDSRKSPLAKVVTSKRQFNVWMPNHGDKMNPSLKMAACPPSSADRNFYRGKKPPREELEIWEDAIRIATQAVVNPERYRDRTKDVSGFFYTSGMGKFYNMKQTNPIIEKRKVDNDACLEVWMESPENRKPAAKAAPKKKK